MACYHPKYAYYTPGEKLAFIKYNPKDAKPWFVESYNGTYHELLRIPCGSCVGCRLAYSKDWANRCVCESLNYDKSSNWFLTLTYDDENVPVSKKGALTLLPNEITSYMKNLRRQAEYWYNIKGIRFFACGEYGSKTLRPHYHILVFNCPVPRGNIVGHNKIGDPFFDTELFKDTWNKGHSVVGEFNYLTAAYTARYILKKQKQTESLVYSDLGIKPEFTRMSLKPGIGVDYFMKNYDSIYENDEIILPPVNGKANVSKPPKIFDRKYKDIDIQRYTEVKDKRKELASIKQDSIKYNLDMSELEYLTMKEESLKNSLKYLPRHIDI